MNRAERRQQKKSQQKTPAWKGSHAAPQQSPVQARARGERGLIRRVSQVKGRGS